ncbi:MAG: TlpA family protein disulfide reductase [Proteobacteria bacterium]|nr:TlpA family protein disulfide reductase [Pseudomonadota bacterium]
MKRSSYGLWPVAMFVFCLLAVAACSSEEVPESMTAPELTLPDLEGREVRLSDYKGRVVVLNLFATWCPPCREETPDLVELQKRHDPADLTVIAVSMDKDGTGTVKAFVRKYKINYPVLYAGDRAGDVAEKLGGIRGVPTSFIIDRQGMIVQRVVGAPPGDFWERAVKGLVAKKDS